MTMMRHLIQERWDAYMRHCVAGVTGQGKGTDAAFAICKAGGNRAGYYKAGTKKVTAKGRRAMRRHAQDAARTGKDDAYDKAIKKEDTMTSMRDLIEEIEQRDVEERDIEEGEASPGPGYHMVFGRWVKADSASAKIARKMRANIKPLKPKTHSLAARKKENEMMAYKAKINRLKRAAQPQ